jgi:DNA-binding cell septation regulator SpoVG
MKTKENKTMKISDVRVYPINSSKTSILANASITIDDAIVIYCKLVESKKGEKFLSLPNHSYEDKDGKTVYKDDVYCLSKEIMFDLLDAVVEEYQDVTEEDEVEKPKKKTTRRR